MQPNLDGYRHAKSITFKKKEYHLLKQASAQPRRIVTIPMKMSI